MQELLNLKKLLNLKNLTSLPKEIRVPNYNPVDLSIGIVHFGLGNFHRAHQAVFTEDAIEKYLCENHRLPAWGITGVSLLNNKSKTLLMPQNGLYSVTECTAKAENTRIIGCLREALFAKEDFRRIFELLNSPIVKIITITVTEKGYCHHPATGDLQKNHPDIIADWQHWDLMKNSWDKQAANHKRTANTAIKTCNNKTANQSIAKTPIIPRSLMGWLAIGLMHHYYKQQTPWTILSCDNLPNNGKILKKVLLQFVAEKDQKFAEWIEQQVCFPCSMVDRITPATKTADIKKISEKLSCIDNAAIITEPFKQWVIENKFSDYPPIWDQAGAVFVKNVTPYELHKLRLLNGCHSALAYLGYLAGYETIDQTISDPLFYNYAQNLLNEITLTLPKIKDFDVEQYKNTLLNRFANSAVPYRTAQVAMDGSQKLPQRLLNTIQDCLEQNLPCMHLTLAVAGWMRYVYGIDEQGKVITLQDPLAEQLQMIASQSAGDPNKLARDLLQLNNIFDTKLRNSENWQKKLTNILTDLFKIGVKLTIKKLSHS